MKTLMIKCPDGYDDVVTVTLIGVKNENKIMTNISTCAVDLNKNNYLTLDGYGEPIMYWQNGRGDKNELG